MRRVVLLAFAVACGGKAPMQPMETAQQADPNSLPAGRVVILSGELLVQIVDPGVRSVEAYLGEELVLVDGDQRWVLAPTEAVTREQLIALGGRRVVIVATQQPATPPNPMEATPMNGDQPMPRADRWLVHSAQEAP
jgi:hypothetical protein